jgi:tetratricopeptide (TPR) repeat protein
MRPFRIEAAAPAASAPAAPVAAVPFASEIERFDRRAVLTRPVLGFFIDRIAIGGVPPIPEALAPAVGYVRMGQFTEARRVVEASGSDHLAGTFLAGIADLAHGEMTRAAQRFTAALRSHPGFFPAAFYLGACYATTGQDREAVMVWRSATVSDPRAPWVFTLLADAQLRLGEIPQALDVLREATRLWPENDDVRMRWATALARAGQGDLAAKVLGPYLERHPADELRLLLGMRLIYEARVAGRPIVSMDDDRTTFLRYFESYGRTPASAMTQAAEWRRFVDR